MSAWDDYLDSFPRPEPGGAARPSKPSASDLGLVVAHGKGASVAPSTLQQRTILPLGWEDETPAELHAAWAALDGRLRVVDPTPF